jgi:rhamnosyltransferase
LNDATLDHTLGNLRSSKLFFLRFQPTHHAAIRRYYMTRNRLYVMKAYPSFIPEELWAWIKDMIKLLIFEKKRIKKIVYMSKGLADFLIGKYGQVDIIN